MNKIFYLLIAISILSACDDEVNIPLADTDPYLNVDAWLTNTPDTQRIILNYTRSYFDNGAPTPVLNANVVVSELQGDNLVNPLVFTDVDNNGIYEWVPPAGQSFGTIGTTYILTIEALGTTYNSFSTMPDVPVIDSITFEYNKKDAFIDEDWYYGEFWSRDLDGPGNTYWIKAFKNGDFLRNPEDISVAYDAGFSAGGAVDSLIFIQPIRTSINSFGNTEEFVSPYTFGDTCRVELHGISNEAWFFLIRVADETVRNPGFAQLFANPLANSPTNIYPIDETVPVVGFFSVASVSSLEVVMSDSTVVDLVPD
ncbi:MAG: hypothetical protein ACJAVY_002180 [Marinoscillum sp.]|jgi:hypothetical protein